jgi:hypothetical protein
MNKRGMLPGHLWMVSSARCPNDFTERKAVEALTDKTIFVRQYSAWETKPRSDFMAETFEVEVGDVTRRSRVLDGSETDVNRSCVIIVPMDYKAEFEKDPDESVLPWPDGQLILDIFLSYWPIPFRSSLACCSASFVACLALASGFN